MQQWKVSKARLHTGYRLSGRSERKSAGSTLENMLENMSRARAFSVPCGGFPSNASGFALGRDVTPGPIESVMSTPSPSSSPEDHLQAEHSPDPVSVDIEEAPGSELAANTGSSRSLDDLVAIASNNNYALGSLAHAFSKEALALTEEFNKHAAALKKLQENLKAVQAEMDLMKALMRRLALMEECNKHAASLKKLQEDLNAVQAEMDLMKAFMRRLAGMTNASMDEWIRFAAEGLSD
ncbi:hypothetical protein B0H65DRAFT_177544 [Neurospora tetraspora]|uniref:Uncharacterized protein n=1 Tax=Neurospora tetraspora TaxID=94610 RepID=A0AAE0MU29_9PEZI|nr:hypothetical protein B0H65DRAFT_177544 [Neurospora tetraspora]